MFNKENVDFLSVLHKQDENYTEIIKQFGQMGKTISEIKDSYTKSTSEIVILQPFEQTFAANGYRCNSIFVSDAAAADNVKLIVSLNAVTWTTNLAAGENIVNIPNQATFKATTTSGFPPSVILTRYNVPGVDNNVTVTNTPGVSLTGTVSPGGSTYVGSISDLHSINGSPINAVAGNADNSSATQTGLQVGAYNRVFNGTGWDRIYNNTQGTLLASAARTATTTSPIQTNYNARGIMVWLNVTVASGTGGLNVLINAIDPVTSATGWINPLPTAVTTTGEKGYLIYPGVVNNSGSLFNSVNSVIPRVFSVMVQHNDASSYTYSLSYALIL